MRPVFKKSDFRCFLQIPLLVMLFFLSRPLWLYFHGERTGLSDTIPPIVGIVVIVAIVYAVVMALRVRDRFQSERDTEFNPNDRQQRD